VAAAESDSSKYQSKYCDGFITAAQYITERICERIAFKDKKTLPRYFWKDKEWFKKFRLQIKFANQLLAEYPADCIIKALRSPKASKIYSLGAKFILVPLIEAEVNKPKSVIEETPVVDLSNIPKVEVPKKKSKLSLLKDLDGQEEG